MVALVSMVLYPDLADSREGFVMVMKDVLPAGLLGLLFAAFIAAFTSTFAAHLNWGTSYLINDFWRRFIRPGKSEKHYVLVSRVVTFLLAVVAFLVTTQLDSIKQAWGLVITASAGLGLVLILRWYWWRVNAWSELSATLAPIAMVVLVLARSACSRNNRTLPCESVLGGSYYNRHLAACNLHDPANRSRQTGCLLPEGQTRRRRMETRSGPKSGSAARQCPAPLVFSTGLPGWYWYTWSFSA